ncbi:YlbF family regulator [Enterococcus durans]|uniref:YlbF family regulator n=1 Tax=Enterococcus durans TaxID=53345 RepID=UPI0018A029DE|nr:YlbF family regulator [Enterococcus durans]
MIINEELFVLEDQCKRLAKCIIESHTMSEYMKTKKQMEQSEEVAQLKADFFKKKEDYEKIAPYKEYAPGYKETYLAVRKAKRQLDLNDSVAAFRIQETQIQNILDEISRELAQAVSSEIKIDAGNPFFEKGRHAGCGGNCHGNRKQSI